MTNYIIKDWANNLIEFENRPHVFKSFDDAEKVLNEELGDNYETDRGEYYILPKEPSND